MFIVFGEKHDVLLFKADKSSEYEKALSSAVRRDVVLHSSQKESTSCTGDWRDIL